MSDFKGQALIDGVLRIVDEHRPLHLSIVGGDPLVRYRELEAMLPRILERGTHVQIVTSAFRVIPPEWATTPHLSTVVSIDGLQPEHDVRRTPATYDRILKNIKDARIIVHCTITNQMMLRDNYLDDFLAFWTPREQVNRVWFSIFTPQIGDDLPEILTPQSRAKAIEQFHILRKKYPKLQMPEGMIKQFAKPPESPDKCVFAQTTQTYSADLRTAIEPCQFGGTPDCSNCGCVASMALGAVAAHKYWGFIPVGALFTGSVAIGKIFKNRRREQNRAENPFPVLP